MRKVLEKLQNPFVLVGQGFILGGALFFALQAERSDAASPSAPISAETAR